MINLTGIKQEFQAKWAEVRICLACQLPCPYAHGTAAATPHISQGPAGPTIPPSPAPPLQPKTSRNESKLQNDEKRTQGKSEYCTPDNS